MTNEIQALIAKLRHDVMIGGGYADISGEHLEQLIAAIDAEGQVDLKGIELHAVTLKPGTVVSMTLPAKPWVLGEYQD